MTKRTRPMTLEEHDARLKEEGRYEAVMERLREQEEVRQKRAAVWREAEIPLVNDLNRAGIHVTSVWDLVNTAADYSGVVPILLDHLQRPYPERVREGIARALAIPEAIIGWPILLKAFQEERDNSTTGVKWALALALGASGTDEVLDDVIPLVKDATLGRNRAPLLLILARSHDRRAREVLKELADDPAIAEDVKKILAKKKKGSFPLSSTQLN